MKTITISIGTLSVKVRSETANATGKQEEITIQVDWRTLRESWQTAKAITLAGLHNLLARYEAHQADRHKDFMAQWPPHSLFCEKRCCTRSINSYHRFLKKQIAWGADGHVK